MFVLFFWCTRYENYEKHLTMNHSTCVNTSAYLLHSQIVCLNYESKGRIFITLQDGFPTLLPPEISLLYVFIPEMKAKGERMDFFHFAMKLLGKHPSL